MNEAMQIGLVSGIAGALVGAFASIHAANRQIAATTISANRQSWINALRDELAALISNLQITSFAFLAPHSFSKDDAKASLRDTLTREARIRLMLNLSESDHARLLEFIDEALQEGAKGQQDGETADDAAMRVREAVAQVVTQSQIVLKREWIRVKEGK